MSFFASGIKKSYGVHYSRGEVINQLFQDDFGLSDSDSSEEEGEYIAHLGSYKFKCDRVAALRSAVASDQ